jgi:uncharacterized protein YciI
MAWFLVQTVYNQEKYGAVRPRHREYLSKLTAEDTDALQVLLDADPYVVEGALDGFTVREFKPTLGAWVQ